MSHILVIDDDKAIGEVMSLVLEDLGHTYQIVTSFETLKKLNLNKYNLILLDGNIGASSGMKTADYLKTHPKLKGTPIVVFSADDNVEKIAKDIGADGILKKPFEIAQLTEIIDIYQK